MKLVLNYWLTFNEEHDRRCLLVYLGLMWISLARRMPGHDCSGGSVHLHRRASSAQLCSLLHGRAEWSDHRGLWRCWHRLQWRRLHHGKATACKTKEKHLVTGGKQFFEAWILNYCKGFWSFSNKSNWNNVRSCYCWWASQVVLNNLN